MSKRDIVSQYLKEKSEARKQGLRLRDHPKSPQIKLDDSTCNWLPVMPFEYRVVDTEVPRLHIRVRESGGKHFEVTAKVGRTNAKSKVCKFRDLGLEPHKVGPNDPAPVTVRSRALELLVEMHSGVSASTKRAEKVIQAEQEKERAAIKERDGLTLFEAGVDYIETAELAESTKNNYVTYLNKHLRDWSDLPMASLGTDEVIQIQTRIKTERGDVAANNALRFFRAVWNVVAEDNPEMGMCPTYVLSKKSKKKVQWAKEDRRDRYVHEKELVLWWAAVEKLRGTYIGKMGYSIPNYPGDGNLMADYLQFALLTGMRRNEITKLKWSNVNFNRGELHLNVDQNLKGKRKWTLPLTQPLIDILERRKETRDSEGKKHPGPFPLHEPRRSINQVKAWSGVDFSMHDLRRSFASHAEATRMPLKTLKLLMNHATGNDVTLGYVQNRDVMLKELQILHNYILDKAGVTSNIVALGVVSG